MSDFGTDLRNGARAEIVNRTHRVIREQAVAMREQRSQRRSLFAPIAICSTLMIIIGSAIWAMLDNYDITPNGVPDASDQLMILLLWMLPVTALAIGVIWFKRTRGRMKGEIY